MEQEGTADARQSEGHDVRSIALAQDHPNSSLHLVGRGIRGPASASHRTQHPAPAQMHGSRQPSQALDPGILFVESIPLAEGMPFAESITFAEYVEQKFIPEYVSARRLSGKAHFQAMLKHIITPERVNRLLQAGPAALRSKLSSVPGWPYLDALKLCEVRSHHVQEMVAAALARGYSPQTVTHIRNVIGAVFTHARLTHLFLGENPASGVILPEMARKRADVLSLEDLRRVLLMTRYPEREAALLATLTDLNMSEICGLQWKAVNLTEVRRLVDDEWIPARAINVTNQSYRCEVVPVPENRRRMVTMPDLLCSALVTLRDQRGNAGPDDYVLAARNGSPMSQCNIAARRLKVIGSELGIERLNWQAFRRTYLALNATLGKNFNAEIKRMLPLERIIQRRPAALPTRQGLPG